MIYIINLVGTLWNFHIGLNYVTAIFTGILGVPRRNFACDLEISARWIKVALCKCVWYNSVATNKKCRRY